MDNYEKFIVYAQKAIESECSVNEFNLLYPGISDDMVVFLKKTISNRNPLELDYVIYVIFYLNIYNTELIQIFNSLLIEDWHYKHEDIVDLLCDYKSTSSCPYLYKASLMSLPYLTYDGDETFAFASKCIHLLGKINDETSKYYLKKLTECADPILKRYAEKQLDNN